MAMTGARSPRQLGDMRERLEHPNYAQTCSCEAPLASVSARLWRHERRDTSLNVAPISSGKHSKGRKLMEPKTLALVGGLFLICVGALLIVVQVAISRRYGMEKSLKRTIMPGLSLAVLGIMLLLFA